MNRKDFKNKSKPGRVLLEREVKFYPAFDKRDPDPNKNYGIHNAEIAFYVKGPKGAVQFKFSSGWQLPHVAKELEADRDSPRILLSPTAHDLGFHADGGLQENQDRHGGEFSYFTQDCTVLGHGKSCYYDGSTLNAESYLQKLIAEGDEAVWKDLEEYYHYTFEDK